MNSDLVISLIGWPILLGAALWYVHRNKHHSRHLINAYGIFLGTFGGITALALTLVVVGFSALDLGNEQIPSAIGGILAVGVVLPAWRFAVRLIKRPADRE